MAEDKNITIPVTAIYKPTYANDFYKLPEDPVKFWAKKNITVGRCLGEGSFAAAYEGKYGEKAELPKGKEKYRGRDFAVKVHHIGYHPYVPGAPNKDKIDEETQNEINFANRTDITHPNIIEFHFTAFYPPDSKTVCDHVFIFMAKAMFPLQDLLNSLTRLRSRIPVSVGVRWIKDIAHGLNHIHKIGIVHNDIHSFNIFVFGDQDEVGNDFRFKNIDLKIADFGKCVDISKEKSDENKQILIRKDVERVCLMFISLSERIGFSDDNRKKYIDLFNQCYQKKITFEDLLKSKVLVTQPEGEDWTIFVAQSV